MLFISVLLLSFFTNYLVAFVFHQGPSEAIEAPENCCEGRPCFCCGCNVRYNKSDEKRYFCGDERLGPAELPTMLPLGTFVAGYDRFGNKSPHEFLEEWWNTTLKEDGTEVGWRYPDMNGFGLDQDGIPIKANVDLEVGTLVDRFGNASGRFISPAAAPFSQRALHPQNLNTDSDMKFPNNYHVYNVTRSFTVFAGPIKPWFGQPGFGVQFFLGVGVRVEDHIGMKNLQPLDSSRLPRQGPPLCHRGENAAGEEL